MNVKIARVILKRLCRVLQIIGNYWRYIFIVGFPIVLLPVIVPVDTQIRRSAYILLWMAGYWITGCIPLYITALLPMLLGPIMGLHTSNELAKEYMTSSNILFISSMFIASTAEHVNLHRRISIVFLRCMGSDPRLIILGIMFPTWFLSMWMSNTATTLLMLTITEAIMERMEAEINGAYIKIETAAIERDRGVSSDAEDPPSLPSSSTPPTDERRRPKWKTFGVGLSLGVCYAASIGGMATLTGTATNIIFVNLLVSEFGTKTGMNFGTYIAYALPISFVILIFTWFVLCLMFLGPKTFCVWCKKKDAKKKNSNEDSGNGGEEFDMSKVIKAIIKEEAAGIGMITWGEGCVLLLFILLIILWIAREPGVDGWSKVMPERDMKDGSVVQYVGDTQPAILVAMLAFMLPLNNPFKLHKSREETPKEAGKRIDEPLLPWEIAQEKCSWGVVLLMGGGFAVSMIVKSSGLSQVIGDNLTGLSSIPQFWMLYLFTMITSLLTEMVSNAATATVILPIMFQFSRRTHMHPLMVTSPMILATSTAFILPAATPPNAVVFAKGRVRLSDMIKTGIILNFAAHLIIIAGTYAYGFHLFDLNAFPDWAKDKGTLSV